MNLEGFNENQKKAVLHMDGACCVLAGAGSGKTRVLTYRIANLIENGIPPENILAVTFTKKASEEMKERLTNLIGVDGEQVNMGTFHSICYQILRIECPKVANSTIAKDWWQKKVVKEIMLPPSTKYPNSINLDWQPRQALSFIGFQKNNLIKPDGNLIIPDNIKFLEGKLRKLYAQYERIKESENIIDFDDMLTMCYDLFTNDKEVLRKYRNKFQYILVDEYQDTNKAQAEIIKLLGKEHGNVFVVGDDYQSIYGFRAGDVEIILNFTKEWNDAEIIPLNINYRSTNNIVQWSNKLILNNTNQFNKEVRANRSNYQDPILFKALDEDDEANVIAEEIVTLMGDGYKPQDFAILYRTNAQSRALEEAMMKNKIPYIVLGSANFYDRKEIKDMLAYLRLSQDLTLDEELERIINKPNRYLGKAFITALNNYACNHDLTLYESLVRCPASKDWKYTKGTSFLHRFLNHLNENNEIKPADMIRLIRKETKYDEWLIDSDDGEEESERIENLNALVITASKFSTVVEFLEYVDSMGKNQSNDKNESNKVKLMSIHRSKGLEFPVVFVAGVSEGLLPHRKSEDIEEERRLCYVAMTRAKELLYMSWTNYYQDYQAGASIFIEELVDDVREYKKLLTG